jgi:hypothetical protein
MAGNEKGGDSRHTTESRFCDVPRWQYPARRFQFNRISPDTSRVAQNPTRRFARNASHLSILQRFDQEK